MIEEPKGRPRGLEVRRYYREGSSYNGVMRLSRLECLVPPPVILLGVAVAMGYGARVAGRVALPTSVRFGAVALLLLCSFLLGSSGIWSFWRARTVINPHKPEHTSTLVVAGVYRFTRNPMYLGLVAALFAWAFYLASPLALLGPFLFGAYITRFQIIPEERMLAQKFGDVFIAYSRKVRRWI